MNPDIPSVSTFRVEKPGKSKFAPSISGRKATKESSSASASTSTNATASATTTTATPAAVSITEANHSETQQREDLVDFAALSNSKTGEEAASSQGKSQGTRIESVASRRQVAKEPRREASGSAPNFPEAPKNAASISTLASGEVATKRTMAYFLKDTGLGREMPATSSTAAKGSAGRSSGRRVVNLKNIKAPRSTTTALAPQVRVVNDKIVYDEEMAAVAAPSAIDDVEDELEYVEDDEHGKHLTSATYAKRSGSNRWNSEETEFFYEALAMCGTDFSMIQTFFPHRTRAQVKGKFKIEERTSPARVAQALKQRKPFDASLKSRIKNNKEEEQ